jgi:hypothetical protein
MSDTMYQEMVHEEIVNYIIRNPRDITYIGLGSSPRFSKLDEFTSKIDQILPVFMMDLIKNTTKTIRVIHYDPMFEHTLEFLQLYFNSKNLELTYDCNEMHSWTSKDQQIEIIICCIEFNFSDNTFYELVNIFLYSNTKLILQSYTGFELLYIFQKLYHMSPMKEKFKNNILFDITYNQDCCCMTDMSKYKPFYNNRNNFMNILLLNEAEMFNLIGNNDEINKIIIDHFIAIYKNIINLQTDYRRIITNQPILFPNHGYTDKSKPGDIMNIIFDKLTPILSALKKLNIITPKKEKSLKYIYHNYAMMDMYKVYEELEKIVKDY